MKKTINIPSAILLTTMLALSACTDHDVESTKKGTVRVEFDNSVGEDDLELNKDYVNSSNETFRLTTLNYYISNIRLRTTTGSEYVVPQDNSYFLIRENNFDSQEIELNEVPAGDYNEITFTIGVDSLRSTMDISKRTGVLDPSLGHDGMYWTWNSGYIFFKLEGVSPSAPSGQENKIYYHIGGYGGFDSPTLNNIRTKTISFGSDHAEVRADKTPRIHLHADVLELFKNPTTIKISEHSLVMFSEFSSTVSGNYVNMFKYEHVHN
jgi:hypothetical protein